jgi:hypothetical protein
MLVRIMQKPCSTAKFTTFNKQAQYGPSNYRSDYLISYSFSGVVPKWAISYRQICSQPVSGAEDKILEKCAFAGSVLDEFKIVRD